MLSILRSAKKDQVRRLEMKKNNYFFETHHILPKSLFPRWKDRDSNKIILTIREHCRIHQLLIKVYPSPQMSNALRMIFGMLEEKKKYFTEDELLDMVEESRTLHREFLKNWKDNPFRRPCPEERKKYYKETLGFPIRCIETGEVYSSQKEAALKTGIGRDKICKNVNGKKSQAGGFHFEYVNKEGNHPRKPWSETNRTLFQLKNGCKFQDSQGNIYLTRSSLAEKFGQKYREMKSKKLLKELGITQITGEDYENLKKRN